MEGNSQEELVGLDLEYLEVVDHQVTQLFFQIIVQSKKFQLSFDNSWEPKLS